MADTRIRRAARRSGLTVGYISRVLNGKRNPRLATAKKIADAMNMSVDQLLRIVDQRKKIGSSADQSARSLAISRGLKARAVVKKLEERASRGHEDTVVDYVGD